jgi:hypothetical protein
MPTRRGSHQKTAKTNFAFTNGTKETSYELCIVH